MLQRIVVWINRIRNGNNPVLLSFSWRKFTIYTAWVKQDMLHDPHDKNTEKTGAEADFAMEPRITYVPGVTTYPVQKTLNETYYKSTK